MDEDSGPGAALGPEFFETMVEDVGVGVAIYGDDGRYRYVNQAYADLFGVGRERLVGAALWEVVVGFERDRFGGYWEGFADGETRTAEAEHRVDGTTVPVATVTTRRRVDGSPYHFGTIRDISERRAREEELRRQNERLDSFAGVVAHDLRNPLDVAFSYLEMLRQDLDREEVELIDSALRRMDTLITDLLSLAREGSAVDEIEPVALWTVASAAWGAVDAPEADLEVDGVALHADPARLQQLLENLFRNAVEHGGPEVTVRVGPLEDGAADAPGFYVADDGPGVPAGERDEVFEPGHTTDDDGTGFGLAIVAEIAEAHGWTVRVTDSESGGARFEIGGVRPA